MKGLLYKEFAISKKALLFSAAFIVLLCIGLFYTHSYTFIFYTGFMCLSMFTRNMTDDEKGGWDKYSRALPQTAYQRVGAKYIFFSVFYFIVLLITWISFMISMKNTREYETILGMSVPELYELYVPLGLLYLSASVVPMAFALLAYYLIKGSLKNFLVPVTFIPALLGMFLLSYFSNRRGGYIIMAFCKPHITAMITAAAFLLLAASYLISVIIETKSGREKKKKAKALAALLTAAALILSGITTFNLYKEGVFEKKEENPFGTVGSTDAGEDSYSYSEAVSEMQDIKNRVARAEMIVLIDQICGKTFIDKREAEIDAEFEKMGYGPDSDSACRIFGKYASDESSEYLESILITVTTEKTVIPSADENSLKEISESLTIGMDEKTATETMFSNSLWPHSVYEEMREGKPCRTYSSEFWVESYEGGESITFSLDVEIIDGVIHDTRSYIQ